MKTSISYSLIAAAMACGFANGQTTAYTTPVGYISQTIVGNVGSSSETILSPSLIQATTFAGVGAVASSTPTIITFTSGVPAGLSTSSVLEISGTGWWSTVTSSDAALNTITVADNFPGTLPANFTVTVRPHSTLLSFLGVNAPGLITYNGADPNDEVLILDPLGQTVGSFAFVSGPDLADPLYPNGAWFNLLTSAVANDQVIEPGTAINVRRIGAAALTFVTTGTVKTTPTQIDLFPNINWIGQPLATGGTLNGMNFQTQLNPYDGATPNYDELQYLRANQTISPFAAADDGGLTMFDLTNSVPAPTEPFVQGTGVIINRIGNPASTITIPGTVVAP